MSTENGFGRIPDDLRSSLAKLSHLEAHVYLILATTAIRDPKRKNTDLGHVNISKRDLARQMGVDRTSLKRAIRGLYDSGLVKKTGSSCPTSWGIVPHLLGPHDPGEGSSCPVNSPQPPLYPITYKPLKRSEDVSEDVDAVVAAKLKKNPPKTKPSFLVWNDDEKRLEVRAGEAAETQMKEFMQLWVERLGCDEGLIEDQLEEADRWLNRYPEKRAKTKRFDRFFGKWLGKLMEE